MSEHKSPPEALEDLLEVMSRLRDPETGCPWDVNQDHTTLAPYVIEEAYEVVEAITNGTEEDLLQELGDLLLQVIFHAQIAKENGIFDFKEIAQRLTEKLIYRHPHVFGDEQGVQIKPEDVQGIWDRQKQAEKSPPEAQSPEFGSDIPKNLPALLRAKEIQKKASKRGFEWDSTERLIAKIQEELEEFLDEVKKPKNSIALEEEYGDLLFVLVNLGKALDLDAETALTKTNTKFLQRFKAMEKLCDAQNKEFSSLNTDEMMDLWQTAKKHA